MSAVANVLYPGAKYCRTSRFKGKSEIRNPDFEFWIWDFELEKNLP
jgi:hypothetical protein